MRHFHWPAAAAVLTVLFTATIGTGADKEAAKKELEVLEGNWQLTRQEERGSLTPKPSVAGLRIVIEGDEMSWYIGNPAPNQTADLKIDPTTDPKIIDAEI